MIKTIEKQAKTSKSAKPVVKSRKVFDVSKPGKGATPATGTRPVIVTHHQIMPDPMVSPTDLPIDLPVATSEAKTAPSVRKVVIKPMSEQSTPGTIELNIPDFETDVPKKKAAAALESQAPPQPDPKPETDTQSAPAQPATEPVLDAATQKLEMPEPSTPQVSPAGQPDELSITDKTKEEQEAAAIEAEIRRQEALDKLVESKEYFLPIRTAEHRRSKIVTLTGLLLIVLLGLLLVNMLLDVGTITIPGVEPLTHFFGSLLTTGY